MLASMDGVDEPWGRRLSLWRRDSMNWSQHELVEQVVRLAFETNEARGTSLDVRLVGRWESGRVMRPQAVYRRLLAQLGAPLPGSASAPKQHHSESGTGEPEVLRRDFLRSGTALVVPGLLGSLMDADQDRWRPSSDLIDELEQRLGTLRKLDATLGGGDTYRLYATEAELTGHMLHTCTNGRPGRLLALHAEQLQQAGWAAFDAGWHDAAHDLYQRSHSAATEAGDSGLVGNALALHAYQLISLGKPSRLVSERSVLAGDRTPVAPGVRALLFSRAAWTFALHGDADATARHLGLAENALALADGETPGYAAWLDASELAIMSGRCWSELRRPLRAVPVLEQALAGVSNARSRDKALYSSWLADSYIDAREIERAVSTVESSIAVMGEVSSVRPRERLAKVVGRLADHGSLPRVRDLLGSDALHPLDVRR